MREALSRSADALAYAPHQLGGGGLHEPPFRQARVLLVDDSQHDVTLAKYFLFGANGIDCELQVARSSPDAMDMLLMACAGGHPIDLVLLDISLPGHNGFALLSQIRAHPYLRKTSVIMCTGSAHEADREQALDHGVAGYLVKPPALDKFRTVVARVPLLDVQGEGDHLRLVAVSLDRPHPLL